MQWKIKTVLVHLHGIHVFFEYNLENSNLIQKQIAVLILYKE